MESSEPAYVTVARLDAYGLAAESGPSARATSSSNWLEVAAQDLQAAKHAAPPGLEHVSLRSAVEHAASPSNIPVGCSEADAAGKRALNPHAQAFNPAPGHKLCADEPSWPCARRESDRQRSRPIGQSQKSWQKLASRPRRRGQLKLAECLEELDFCDPDKVLRVSRLGRLGAQAERRVQEFMEKMYGPVERVLRVNPPENEYSDKPSNMVFMVFRNADDAQRVIAAGVEHTIEPGVTPVMVRGFERKEDMEPERKVAVVQSFSV